MGIKSDGLPRLLAGRLARGCLVKKDALADRREARVQALVAALDKFPRLQLDELKFYSVPPWDTVAAFGALLRYAWRELYGMVDADPRVSTLLRRTPAGRRVLARMKAGEDRPAPRGRGRAPVPDAAAMAGISRVLDKALGTGEDGGGPPSGKAGREGGPEPPVQS